VCRARRTDPGSRRDPRSGQVVSGALELDRLAGLHVAPAATLAPLAGMVATVVLLGGLVGGLDIAPLGEVL
jgi:hypothetical protein